MSQNRLVLNGLTELRSFLRLLPIDLANKGGDRVEDTTEIVAASLTQSYPLGDSGNLRKGVRKVFERSPFGVRGIVRSTSPHAHLWEFGTAVRATRAGWNRGVSPEHKADGLIPIAQRERRRLNSYLIELVRAAGFRVSGTL